MRIISKMRKQTAVYWAVTGYDEYGQPNFSSPVQIKCRWVRKVEEFVNAKGVTQVSQAIVYVDRDVDLGGYLQLGLLVDLDSAGIDPKFVDGAWEIMRFDDLPTLRATNFLKTAYL